MMFFAAAGSPDWLAPAGGGAFVVAVTSAVVGLVRYVLKDNRRTASEQARLLVRPLERNVTQLQRRDANCREAMQLVTEDCAKAGVAIRPRVWVLLRDNGERPEDDDDDDG